MSLETRARDAAEGARAATAVDPEAWLARLRRTHRRRSATRVAAGLVAALALVVAGLRLTADRDTAEPAPVAPPSVTSSSSSSTTPVDTSSWTTYRSEQYGFEVGHPPNWTVAPATRDWRAADVRDWRSPAHDAFTSPDGAIRVSVWSAPLGSDTRVGELADLLAWVEQYCGEGGSSPCSPDPDRTVELCLEKWDCHPGVLVRFDADVQAFFSGGIYAADAMTIVSVWRPESHVTVAPYGGSQHLLEGFLSTMQVWPASTPIEERECYGGPPQGLDCDSAGSGGTG